MGGSGFVREREFQDSALGKATVKAVAKIISDVRGLNLPPGARSKLREKKGADQQQALLVEAAKVRSTPGLVEAVGDGYLIVTLGAKHGVRLGQKLLLYEIVEIKNKEGKAVFTDKKLAGEIVAETVEEDKTKARYAGAATVKEGWIVRQPELAAAPQN